nr:16S rRNA (guanine(527)-N(7))-methyltransferase RsmG [Lachnospiraceae bacterium]
MDQIELIKNSINKIGLECSDDQVYKFLKYYEHLIEWNKNINLTSITDFNDVLLKHFIDSILICSFIDLKGKNIIDIGTGAGFPGIPLKIIEPECNIVLLDSLNKRIKFLDFIINDLNLSGIKTIHGRAEDYARNIDYRYCFDISVSRAVANLNTLSEYCIPFLKKGGIFISYKSDKSDEEINNCKNALKVLCSEISYIKD